MDAPRTLKKRADFLLARMAGQRWAATGLVLQMRKRHDDGPAQVGYTVSKKVGNAVERNRVRRRLRAAVREVMQLQPGRDYVIIGRRAALARSWQALIHDLRTAAHRVERR
ncbi:MAG: ribonuclease P protein component [Alphaproteobacteria bacterium]|nr:ribonuclease P protein component [Alphaproteobacteria bacterium]MCY4317787.1 ribonuclease P protein component [Alphaproteobacteria bacterium]